MFPAAAICCRSPPAASDDSAVPLSLTLSRGAGRGSERREGIGTGTRLAAPQHPCASSSIAAPSCSNRRRADLDPAALPEVRWDPRVLAHRAPAHRAYAIASELRRRGVALDGRAPSDARPTVRSPAAADLRPYQEAALAAWRLAGAARPDRAAHRQRQDARRARRHRGHPRALPLSRADARAARAVAGGARRRLRRADRALRRRRARPRAADRRHLRGRVPAHGAHRRSLRSAHRRRGPPLRARHARTRRSRCRSRRSASGSPPRRPSPDSPPRASPTLIGPVVFERSIADLAGPYLAPLERITWHLALDPEERREYDALRAVYRRAWGAYLGQSPERALGGLSPARVADGRRAARGRGVAAGAAAARVPAAQARGAGGAARAPSPGADAGLRGGQRDGVHGRARAPGHAAHLRHRAARARRGAGPLPRGRAAGAGLRPGAERGARRPRRGGRDRGRGAAWARASTCSGWGGCSGPGRASGRSSTSWSSGTRARPGRRRGGGGALLSQSDLPLRLLDDRAYLEYLGAQDEPWLRVLVAEMQRFEGRRRRELAERLAEPLPCDAPYFKRRAASRVLFRIWNRASDGAAAARSRGDRVGLAAAAVRAAAVRRGGGERRAHARPSSRDVAARLGVAPDALDAALFADLPGERPVRAPDPIPTPAEIALHTNLALAQTVVMRAAHVVVARRGRRCGRSCGSRSFAACSATSPPPAAGALPRLDISGPFSLFRHTLVYGRALAELLPHLAWCARFELAAVAAPARPARARVDGERRPDLPGARAGAVRQPPGGAVRGDVAPPGPGLGRDPRARAAAGGRVAHLPRLPRPPPHPPASGRRWSRSSASGRRIT